MKLLKWFRTFVDFSLFLSTSLLITSVKSWFRTNQKRFRTLQDSSGLFFSTYPCGNIEVLNFLNLGTHREREIKKESDINIKLNKLFKLKPKISKKHSIEKEYSIDKKHGINKEHILEFSFDGKFLKAICLMVAMLTARLGGLT